MKNFLRKLHISEGSSAGGGTKNFLRKLHISEGSSARGGMKNFLRKLYISEGSSARGSSPQEEDYVEDGVIRESSEAEERHDGGVENLLRKLHIGKGSGDRRMQPSLSVRIGAEESTASLSVEDERSRSQLEEHLRKQEEDEVERVIMELSEAEERKREREKEEDEVEERVIKESSEAEKRKLSLGFCLPLAARYWYFDALSYDDKILNGFYDIFYIGNGQESGSMPSLAELRAQPLSCRGNWEAVFVHTREDPELMKIRQEALTMAPNIVGCSEYVGNSLVQRLARLVARHMGGTFDPESMTMKYQNMLNSLRSSIGSIVVPLGELKIGLPRHRALLFKVLADELDVPCQLLKGKRYTGLDDGVLNIVKFKDKREFIVDLMDDPGTLIPSDGVVLSAEFYENFVSDNHQLQKDDTTNLMGSLIEASSRHDNHEVILQDQSAESCDLRLQPGTIIPSDCVVLSAELNENSGSGNHQLHKYDTTNLMGSYLNEASSRHGNLEVILQDPNMEPCDLRLHPGTLSPSDGIILSAEFNESFGSDNNQLIQDDTTDMLGSSLNGASIRHDNLEVVLQDQSAEPCHLRLQYLIDITDNFSDKREVGRGGFGVVYKGMLPNGAMVAVKNLVLSMAQIQDKDKKFKNEIDNLMRVKHQNIVRFVGYCYETQMKYIKQNGKHILAEAPKRLLCFEYVPRSLDTYISEESHGLDWHNRYKIIEGICCGLYYLHEDCQISGSIIHMDLKPANILLDDNMVPKIADFGLSKLFDDQKTRTCTEHRSGSLGYMAPEYLHQGTITRKADIYSLGVIIIEIVAGHKISPYDTGETRSDFVELVLGNWRNRLEASPSCTSLEIYYQQIKSCLEIGLSCVKVDPRERPSIREIIERLDINKA